MKKLLIGTLAVIFLVSPLALIHAENASTSPTSKPWRGGEEKERGGWKDKMMFGDRMEGIREKMEERRDEMHARFDIKRADVITNILNRLEQRFQNAIDHMTKVTVRIQERITLLEDNGGSFDEAQGFLDNAKDGIKDAQKALDDIDLTDAVATTTPATSVKAIREEFKIVKDLLRDAHSKLVDTINSIKRGLSTDRDDDNE